MSRKKKSRAARYAEKWQAYFQDTDCRPGSVSVQTWACDPISQAMAGVWANICDFLDAEEKSQVHHFDKEAQLAEYTLRSRRTFPMVVLEQNPGGPVKLLMANSLHPRRGGARKKAKTKANNTQAAQGKVLMTGFDYEHPSLVKILAGMTLENWE